MRRRVRIDSTSEPWIIHVQGDLPYWRVVEVMKTRKISYEEPGGRQCEGKKMRLLVDGALSGYEDYPPAPFLLDVEEAYGGWEITAMWPVKGEAEATTESPSP